MTPEQVHTDHIRATLDRLVVQGLSTDMASRGLECSTKMLRLIAEYEGAGILALGLVAGIVDGPLPITETTK
jgi:hypothetical protein